MPESRGRPRPGSRSTPLALAAWAADRAGDLRVHVRIDERSAGFLALGLAMGGAPVAVVTTSGTAVGNLLPAVMEAHHAGRPLVVVSADRPDHLRGTGANQTTDQVGIFGRFAATTDLRTSRAAQPGPRDHRGGMPCRRSGPPQRQLDGLLVPDPATPWWPVSGRTERTPAYRLVTRPGRPETGTDRRHWAAGRTLVVAGDDAGPAADPRQTGRLAPPRQGRPQALAPAPTPSGPRVCCSAPRCARGSSGSSSSATHALPAGHRPDQRPRLDVLTVPDPRRRRHRPRPGGWSDQVPGSTAIPSRTRAVAGALARRGPRCPPPSTRRSGPGSSSCHLASCA